MAEADTLFELRTLFQLGNYQGAINAGNKAKVRSDKDRTDRDVLVYRSYIAQGNYSMVLDEIGSSPSSPDLQAVRLLATYLSNPEKARDATLSAINQWLSDLQFANNATAQVVIGTVYIQEQNFESALRVLRQSNTLEGLSLMVLTLLKIDRVDVAEKELTRMKSLDEDATITQLTQAWVNIALGGEKPQEAFYIFKDMAERYAPSPLLLNGQAVCHMSSKKWEDAERVLLEASEKNSKDPDTLANLITCYTHMRKPQEVISRYLNQLRAAAPSHPWVLQLKIAEESFERNLTRFAL